MKKSPKQSSLIWTKDNKNILLNKSRHCDGFLPGEQNQIVLRIIF